MSYEPYGLQNAPEGWSIGDPIPEGYEGSELTAEHLEGLAENAYDQAVAAAAAAVTAVKGQANGLASLGSDGKVPTGQLPTAQSGSGVVPVTTIAASGASRTLTASADGSEIVYSVTLTADCVFTLAGGTAGEASYLTVRLKQGGSGSYLASWLGTIAWPNQAPPLLSTAVGVVDLITLYTLDGGATWDGLHAGHAIQQPSAPAAPTGLAGVVTLDVPNLGWNAPTNNGGSPVTGYKVYRGTTSGAETLLATIGNVTSYADSSAVAATQYWYKVAAVNAIGTGAQSNEITLGGGPTIFAELTSPAAGPLTSATAEHGGPITQHPAFSGTAAIVDAAHRVRSGDAGQTNWIFAATPPSADYTVSATIRYKSAYGYVGVIARADPTADTCYMMRNDSGIHWRLYRYVAGTPTEIAAGVDVVLTYDTDYLIDLVCTGSNITGFVDGVQVFNVTDATISAAGKVGMFFYQASGDDVTGGFISDFSASA